MSASEDPLLLREQLLDNPGDAQLRCRYLACRTPELLARDRQRAVAAVVVAAALVGMVAFGALGLLLGGMGGGTMVVSIGSVHMETRHGQIQVRSHGAAVVSQGGGVKGALSAASGTMPIGGILGALVGLAVGGCIAGRLANDGPRSWLAYCPGVKDRRRRRVVTEQATAQESAPPTELFLVHPSNRAFLDGQVNDFHDRPAWSEPVRHLGLAGMMLFLVQVLQMKEPPIPQRFLEEPWRPAPVPVVLCFLGVGIYLLLLGAGAGLRWWQGRRLLAEGQILYGQVVTCSAIPRTASDSEGAVIRFWQVDLQYEFTTTGQTVTDHIQFRRGELDGRQPPAPGTAVAILYAAEHLYQIL
jgi:hypothetical protein